MCVCLAASQQSCVRRVFLHLLAPWGRQQLRHVDGIMIGRAAYQNPYWLAQLDQEIFQPEQAPASRAAIFRRYSDYMLRQEHQGVSLKSMSRHIIGLYQGQPGARQFRRILSAGRPKVQKNSEEVLDEALESVSCMSL